MTGRFGAEQAVVHRKVCQIDGRDETSGEKEEERKDEEGKLGHRKRGNRKR